MSQRLLGPFFTWFRFVVEWLLSIVKKFFESNTVGFEQSHLTRFLPNGKWAVPVELETFIKLSKKKITVWGEHELASLLSNPSSSFSLIFLYCTHRRIVWFWKIRLSNSKCRLLERYVNILKTLNRLYFITPFYN